MARRGAVWQSRQGGVSLVEHGEAARLISFWHGKARYGWARHGEAVKA